jgi:hypothetical protein
MAPPDLLTIVPVVPTCSYVVLPSSSHPLVDALRHTLLPTIVQLGFTTMALHCSIARESSTSLAPATRDILLSRGGANGCIETHAVPPGPALLVVLCVWVWSLLTVSMCVLLFICCIVLFAFGLYHTAFPFAFDAMHCDRTRHGAMQSWLVDWCMHCA